MDPVKYVDRPAFTLPLEDLESMARRYEEKIVVRSAKADLSAADLERLAYFGLNAAAYRCSVDAASPSIRQNLAVLGTCAAAFLTLARSEPGEGLDVDLPGCPTRLVTSAGWSSDANTVLWERGYFAAMATRDHQALALIARVPMTFLQRSRLQAADWVYLRLEAFAAFARRDPDAPQRELAAFEALDPGNLDALHHDHSLDVGSPTLDLLYQVMVRDQPEFDRALVAALEGHRRYYQLPGNRRDVYGQIALPALALCVEAEAAGMSIRTESPYLPPALLAAT